MTFGATGAIAATMLLGLLEAGDAVGLLDPYYDPCAAAAVLAEAFRRLTALRRHRLRSRAMAMSGTVSTDVDAAIETVWAIVQDVESAPEWQRGIDATDALARDGEGRATSCETVTDLRFKVFRSRLRFSYFPPDRLSWRQEQGELKSLHGSWQLEDLGDGRTRATYALHADPGALLSRFLKGALEEKLRAVLIDGRAAELKARAEATAGS